MLELRKKRMNEGLSPEALAQKLELSGVTIRRIEDGYLPTPAIAKKVADYLDKQVLDVWPELGHPKDKAAEPAA